MALINCPNCGSMISDKAPACPKCGAPAVKDNGTQLVDSSLHSSTPSNRQSEMPPPDQSVQSQQTQRAPGQPAGPRVKTGFRKPKPKVNKLAIIFIILGVVIGFGSVFFYFYITSKPAITLEPQHTPYSQELLKKAESGDDEAQWNVGNAYLNGEGVTKNETEAYTWYLKAADQDYVPAQYNLALCLFNGQGVTRDGASAIRWMEKAANSGYAPAELNLGLYLLNGWEVEKNETKGYSYVESAASKDFLPGKSLLGQLYLKGVGTQQNIQKGFDMVKECADLGDPDALMALATCYYDGVGCTQDKEKALEYIDKVEAADLPLLNFCAGQMLYNLDWPQKKKCKDRGLKLMMKAADQGVSDAVETLKSLGQFPSRHSHF